VRLIAAFFLLLAIALSLATNSQASRDGIRFDPGAAMTHRAEGAPEQLDRAASVVGQWDVTYQTWIGDSLAINTQGEADITYMNRGHGIMERFHSPDAGNGSELNTVMFLVYNPLGNKWVMGLASSYTENVSILDGDFADGELVMYNAARRLGGAQLTFYRTTFTNLDVDAFDVETATSTDMGRTWSREVLRSYQRRQPSEDFMAPATRYGDPVPGLPEEARQFDFLIGEWNESQDMTFPNGQNVRFPSNGTGVYALNGHAVLEFSWYDVDTTLPDAATSVVRIYNRQMRRWECMYTTNRFNSILYFGGVKEGDRIVLHLFEANTEDSPLNQWVFHDVEVDAYSWYANTSVDRGQTWNKTWVINAVRK
jgi:hypothetical protein